MSFIGEFARYNHDTTFVASVTVPVTANVAAGSSAILIVNAPSLNASSAYTVTDTKGNTWTARGLQVATSSTNGELAFFGASNLGTALTTSDTITVTSAERLPANWNVLGLNFSDVTSGFDSTAGFHGNPSTTPGTAMSTGSTATPDTANELVIAAFGFTDTSSTRTVTPEAGFTAQAKLTNAGSRGLYVMWKYVTTIAARSGTATLSGGEAWVAGVAAWRQDTTPSGTGPFWALNGASAPTQRKKLYIQK